MYRRSRKIGPLSSPNDNLGNSFIASRQIACPVLSYTFSLTPIFRIILNFIGSSNG